MKNILLVLCICFLSSCDKKKEQSNSVEDKKIEKEVASTPVKKKELEPKLIEYRQLEEIFKSGEIESVTLYTETGEKEHEAFLDLNMKGKKAKYDEIGFYDEMAATRYYKVIVKNPFEFKELCSKMNISMFLR